MEDIVKYIMGVAAKSNDEKRQVGCVITGENIKHGTAEVIVSEGYNDHVHHAERNAINNMPVQPPGAKLKAYVTHQPCPDCAKHLADAGITEIEVVEAFMKFDGDKLRYDLIDPEFVTTYGDVARDAPLCTSVLHNALYMSSKRAIEVLAAQYKGFAELEEALAKVLTDGARKYKPGNWKLCKDPGRYLAAAIRHSRALKRGEVTDPDSGSPHVDHILTNLMFLYHFNLQKQP